MIALELSLIGSSSEEYSSGDNWGFVWCWRGYNAPWMPRLMAKLMRSARFFGVFHTSLMLSRISSSPIE